MTRSGSTAPARRRPGLRLVLAAWLMGLGVDAAMAVEPSRQPQVRVFQDMHNAAILQIRADAQFRRVATVSADKTLRVWRMPDLTLLRTVHLPSETGGEGIANAVAMSADGRTAYVGGLTGSSWGSRKFVLYAIDLVSGQIRRRLGAFGHPIIALDLSPDGRRLAVGLNAGGLVVLDTSSGEVVHADAEYAGLIRFVHHAADGRLAVSADDGCLRVYDRAGRLLHRDQYPQKPRDQPQCTGERGLGGVRFSPDGRWLALGILAAVGAGAPEAVLLDAVSLQVARTLRADEGHIESLCCVAWAPDASTLYLSAETGGEGPTPIYRLADPGSGAVRRWSAGSQTITNMLPLPGGEVIFSTTAPALMRVDASGAVARVEPGNVDFHRTREDPSWFRVSPDGRTVAFEAQAGRWVTADGTAAPGDALRWSGTVPASLRPAARRGVVSVETGTGRFSFRQPVLVNGHRIDMLWQESVRSWDAHPSRPIAALGSTYGLRVLDARGVPLPNWQRVTLLPAPVYHTQFSDDGRWVIVAVGDGTVRWYDVDSGQERLGLFVHANQADWVFWRHDGYFVSSPEGDRYIGWLVNRSTEQSPDVFRAVQFERHLYRPDLVRATFARGRAASPPVDDLATTLARLAPPRVVVQSAVPAREPGFQEITFSVQATGRPVREIGVFVDGLPTLPAKERAVAEHERERLTRTVTVRGTAAGRLRIEAESEQSIGLDELAAFDATGPAPPAEGRLWVVSVGVQRFDHVTPALLEPLPFTDGDATTLARTLAGAGSPRASDSARIVVLTETSSDGLPTKGAIVRKLQALEQMRPEDTLVVFMSSHGITDVAEYYIAAKDTRTEDVNKVLQAQRKGERLPEGAVPSLISGTELAQLLRRLPGRRILMLDTCHAAAAGGAANPYALFKRSASAQVALVSAAMGDELSWEAPGTGYSLFTLEMINALKPSAERHGRGPVTLRQAFDAAVPRVQEVLRLARLRETNPKRRDQLKQTPVLSALPVLESTVLADN